MTHTPERAVPVTLLVPEPLAVDFQLKAADLLRALVSQRLDAPAPVATAHGTSWSPIPRAVASTRPGFVSEGAIPWGADATDVERAVWVLEHVGLGPRRFLACLALQSPNHVPAKAIARAAGYDGGAKSLTAITGIVSLKSREVEREWAFVWCGHKQGDTWYAMRANAGEVFQEAISQVCPELLQEVSRDLDAVSS